MKKMPNPILLKLAILFLALQDVGAGAATPALGAIAAAFPGVSPTVIQNVSTLPALTVVIFGLLYGVLVKVMRKRSIMWLACILFLVGGLAPAWLNNIYAILFFRALVGCGVGLLYPMANDLVVDFFEGNERKKMIGWTFAVGMLGGIFFQQIGGALSDINWHYTFYAYFAAVLFFALPIIFLPEPVKKEEVVKGTSQEKAKMPASQYVNCIINMIWCFFFITIVTNAAMIIVGENIGTGAQIGTVFSMMTAAAFFGGFFFGAIHKALHGLSMFFCFWVVAIGLYVFYAGHSLGMCFLAMAIIGLGMGFTGSFFFNKSTDIVPFAASAMSLALMTAFNGLGQFLSPFIMNPLVAALGLPAGRPSLLVAAIGLAIVGVFAYIFDRVTPKIAESEKPNVAAQSQTGSQVQA
ncbi:MFS transporter [Dehalobacter sp. DCM]|uniref:MFS transporter n=1 Tax=Dehalobacter sp. DCM TaxID=2907827 RepID=UPI003081398A|nr:MFS transporter [Dehalobacter sp. DCM]